MKISVIFACSKNNVIGVDNDLPWKIKHDLEHFKALTTNKVVIMGSNTWRSFGAKPLPNRENVVITSNSSYKKGDKREFGLPSHYDFPSLREALEFYREQEEKEVFIIGGKRLIEEAIPIADQVFITVVDKFYECPKMVQLDMFDTFLRSDILRLHVRGTNSDFHIESTVQCTEQLRNCTPISFTFFHLKKIVS